MDKPSSRLPVRRVENVAAEAEFAAAEWSAAMGVDIASARPESSDFRPAVKVKIVHDGRRLGLRYRVEDAYIQARAAKMNDSVCFDSCVEFFVRPGGGTGYINFEFSVNGTMLASHIRDHRRSAAGFADFTMLTPDDVREVKVFPAFTGRIDPEIGGPVTWEMGISLPVAMICGITGAPLPETGSVWYGNFYKCADHSSHPHWLSWQPMPELNFHEPAAFGELVFE